MGRLLTVEEVAERFSLSKARVYGLILEKRLPGVVRIGRTLRINPDELDRFIEQGGAALPGGWRREPVDAA